jgi:hypothetical protein
LATLPADDERLDPLRDMLHASHYAANGAPDKTDAIAAAVGSVALFLAREKLHEGKRLEEAMQVHATACPLRAGPGGKLRGVWLFRWQLTVLVAIFIVSVSVGVNGPEIVRVILSHGKVVAAVAGGGAQ